MDKREDKSEQEGIQEESLNGSAKASPSASRSQSGRVDPMSTEPGACPFCGGIDLLAAHLSDIALKYCWSHERWAVICKNCGAIGPHVDVKRDGPGTTKLGMTESFEIWSRRPATPAPESPAPAPAGFATWWESYRRWDDDFRYPASEEGEHKATAFAAWQAAQSPVTPRDIGTGSETSPDAGAPKREATPNVPLAKKLMRYDESWRLIELMVQYLETDRIMGIRVPETSLDWLRAAKARLTAQAPTRTGKGPQ